MTKLIPRDAVCVHMTADMAATCPRCNPSLPTVRWADPACDHCGIDPAAIREAALREAYEVVYKWWFGDGNALPQELILALIGEKK